MNTPVTGKALKDAAKEGLKDGVTESIRGARWLWNLPVDLLLNGPQRLASLRTWLKSRKNSMY